MAGVTAQGGTFSFAITGGSTYTAVVTSVSVEAPQAEVVDMTAIDDPADEINLAPSGLWAGGSVSVGYIHGGAGATDVRDIVRKHGTLSFSSAGYSVSRKAILESATAEGSVNDIVRGNLKFRLTDYTG